MSIIRIHGGTPAPLHAVAGEYRWDCGPDEGEAIFELRVMAAATEFGEPNLIVAGRKVTRGSQNKSLNAQ
ncbi:hypothetical protein [Acidisoma sp. S159]|uniref:hypothetical protein n=1 Tax=Acidisoma sp. S159 TaxID=1747225 RepID=UPI00131D0E70|nr:hypothetical protein [Acidisoma sp. S159]